MIAQNDRNKILSKFVFLHFFPGCLEKLKNSKNVIFYPKNDQKIENFRNFFEKFFWSESIQNGSKRILKWKFRFWKFFPVEFFLDSRFFEKLGHRSKKWQRQKFLVEKIFLVGIDSEWSKTYFKTKISISKIFSHCDLS